MRRLLVLVSLLVLPMLLPADEKKDDKKKEEKPAPNTLTKEEIQKGWLLLFDGESTFGLRVQGEAKVEKGILIVGPEEKKRAGLNFGTRFPEGDFHYEYQTESDDVLISIPFGDTSLSKKLAKGPWRSGVLHVSSGNSLPGYSMPKGASLKLKNVKFLPKNLTPIFNGKDLTGWKPYKGDARREKSKFTVTKEGFLNVKDGAGDLATEKKYDDFVLQLECISNGKHLNSGIFFRCLPGEYQQGYEAQIRNEFEDKDQKYVVEEYDPKTNKLTGKKEVLSLAKDYGTGAIYNRIPARKQASKDGEWFTMTVVARERHFATWVNGVQQVDWTDNRKAAKTGRLGYYGEAGCISIQGHDPTTDLSFRNLRIAVLPRAK